MIRSHSWLLLMLSPTYPYTEYPQDNPYIPTSSDVLRRTGYQVPSPKKLWLFLLFHDTASLPALIQIRLLSLSVLKVLFPIHYHGLRYIHLPDSQNILYCNPVCLLPPDITESESHFVQRHAFFSVPIPPAL